ncbi:hypothetical protein PS664_05441 [Pseudomonas fluorescens]|jgi:hypothetical protein|nr:hypothetical protein PS664_05441 [Pseudomonas fluorescens]
MKFTLLRNIHFHSPEAGLVAQQVAKDVESDIPPQVGYEYEESAWHRNDRPKVQSVLVNVDEGFCIVELDSMEVQTPEAVKAKVEVILAHPGWRKA